MISMPNSKPSDSLTPTVTPRLLLAREVGERFFRVSASLQDLFSTIAGRHGLSVTQARLLRLVYEPMPQQNLADAMGVDAPRVSQLTKELEGLGFVDRVVDDVDRRVKRAQLTADGQRVLLQISQELVGASPLATALTMEQLSLLSSCLESLEAAIKGPG